MKSNLIPLVIFGVLVALPAAADTNDVPVTLKVRTDEATDKDYVRVDAVSITLPAGKNLGHAQLSFRGQVSAGQLVELWIDDGGETLPWRRNPIDRSLRADRWVVDERTGDLIQFDLTGVLSKALQDKKSLPGLYVRVLPDDEGNPQSLSPARVSAAKVSLNLQRKQ